MDNLKRARTRANSRFSVLVICVFLKIVIMVIIVQRQDNIFLTSKYDYKWLAVCVLSHGRRVANVDQIIGCDGQVGDHDCHAYDDHGHDNIT